MWGELTILLRRIENAIYLKHTTRADAWHTREYTKHDAWLIVAYVECDSMMIIIEIIFKFVVKKYYFFLEIYLKFNSIVNERGFEHSTNDDLCWSNTIEEYICTKSLSIHG